MKCKKIFINILESKDTIQEINDVIEEGDLQGYHIILENKTPDKFSCEFLVNSWSEIFWSIDMKKTVKQALNIGVEEYK
jgi:DNA/RNA-binding domain of Phe-tRNA-synthetase-like protein